MLQVEDVRHKDLRGARTLASGVLLAASLFSATTTEANDQSV